MKEKIFIELIKKTLNSEYIGDDCAYLKDLGIVVSQDSLVEDVHFSCKYFSPYQLGYKSVMVNISDICASGAEPKYITIALSLPDSIDENFVEEFYKGAKAAAGNVQIVGGDITGADKIFISVAIIGSVEGRHISSRSGAKVGQKIILAGLHGMSGVGLRLLLNENFPELNNEEQDAFKKAHLMPKAQLDASKRISTSEKTTYAMMDTSDGLADALITIANSSNVMLEVDFDKIKYYSGLSKLEKYEELILYGGEDYGLVATVSNSEGLDVIGEVREGSGVKINYKNFSQMLTKEDVENNIYKHFEE